MTTETKEAARRLQEIRSELQEIAESDPAKGFAAQEEIEEAIPHLEAAMVDLGLGPSHRW